MFLLFHLEFHDVKTVFKVLT